tara:strand:+ start:210 stop:965 length:756 start_codon:yes stop_codon:yes gene_type:complete
MHENNMSIDAVLDATRELEAIIEEGKAKIDGGVHLELCAAVMKVFKIAKGLKKEASDDGSDDSDDEAELDGEENEESDSEPERERTEDDMGVNELSDLWEWQFDFGRPGAVIELDFPIEEIKTSEQPKRVCAAVRVLNRALKGSKPDDPADAERILEWKEELVAELAIRVCSEILEGVDDRAFHNPNHEEHWLYSCICDEILELFQRLGENDALFRTKLRRNGALKGVQAYAKECPYCKQAQDVLDMLKQR